MKSLKDRENVPLPGLLRDVIKNCNILKYTVYLNSLLLLLVNHVPHLKQNSKRIPITRVQRPKRLRIHKAP